MFWLSGGLFLTLVSAHRLHASTVHQDWTLSSVHIAPDGFTRSAALVNGQFPGPLLTANKGDTVVVNVHNKLTDPSMRRSTSIHWHGINQHRNAFNDGPSFVTQCPIAPGESYPYTLALGDQAGTYWYHSHLSTQYVDGIRGPIVIYDPHDPYRGLYDVDDAGTVITLADWYHSSAEGLLTSWISGSTFEPVPDSGLINGKGRFNGGKAVTRARINVTRGKRYRFRVLSLAAVGNFEFAIANHSLTVIEADGILHQPYVVDAIQMLAGQRYSVIVHANQSIDNYWIRATQTNLGATTSPTNPNFNGTDTFAVLHYDRASNAEPTAPQPTSLPPGGIEFAEFNLKPLINPGPPGGSGKADRVLNFTFGFEGAVGQIWTMNGTQYKSPSVPTLLNILANGFVNESQFPADEVTYVLPPNSVIEVNFIGGAGHPFHLHGHSFDVIQSASGGGPNFHNPPRRDVVSSGGTNDNPMSIRFKTDNPGPWFLHCHIDWHLAAGLAAVFAEDPKGIDRGPQSVQPNPQWEQLCAVYNRLSPDLQ